MSRALYSLLFLFAGTFGVRAQLVINELLPANHGTTTDSAGRTPDWIEIYNPTTRPVDLQGWRLAMAGRQHVFTAPLLVAPRGHRLLWCDGRSEEGPDHIAFKLAREGGALLLIAPDGITIADVFSHPAMPGDVSIGRHPDGARAWSYFTEPTAGRANTLLPTPIRTQCSMPQAADAGFHPTSFPLTLLADSSDRIRFTLDGSSPLREGAMTYTAPLVVDTSVVLRAVAQRVGALDSEELRATYLIGEHVDRAMLLNLDPKDLWDDSTGIYTTGVHNNNTRRGKEWERAGWVLTADGAEHRIGVRLSGSGSRGARKRSFKLYAREDDFHFADGAAMSEGLLRADATPHAFLRNTLLEELVRRHGLYVDVQHSAPVPLYLNAKPWGLYRWMPAKDADWLKARNACEAVDLLEGPAFTALSGSNDHFLRAQELLVHGAPVDSIEAMMDLASLVDLACMDLWTGRADHEMNVRCYRPRQPGGRWKWVLFDMDLWAPPNENSVQRMCLAAAPETPFVPHLLAHPALQQRLLARMTALQAAVFAQVVSVADSIHRANEVSLLADFRRWELELDMPHPDSSLAAVKRFATTRPDALFAHLARHTGRKLRTVQVEAPAAELGRLLLNGLALAPGTHAIRCFSGVPVELEAKPAAGVEFADWKGTDLHSLQGTVDLTRTRNLRPVFRSVVP